MAAVSNVEEGVVELHTDVGCLYVRPTGWQRLYLRWTFRNFHSLSREILNPKQKRLIDSLCRNAVVSPGERAPAAAVIGIVENVKVLALPSTAEVPEGVKAVAEVAPERFPVLQARAENEVRPETSFSPPLLSPPQTPEPLVNIPETGADEPTSVPDMKAERVIRPTKRPATWLLASVGGAATAVLLLAIYLPSRGVQRLQSASAQPPVAPPVVVQQKPAAAVPLAPEREKAEAARAPDKPQTPPGAETPATNGRRYAKAAAPVPAPKPAEAITDAAQLPVIAEAPQSGFIYPIAPHANLVGKVVLKAVVGSDGAVKQVEVLSGEKALAAAAARAVRQWHYAPPQVEGRTVEAQTQVTISFLGDDAVSIILPQPK